VLEGEGVGVVAGMVGVLKNDDGAAQIVGSADVKAKGGREPFKVTGPNYWKDRLEKKLASKK
jgi:hypothetical protein